MYKPSIFTKSCFGRIDEDDTFFSINILRNKQQKSTTIYRKSFFFEAKCVGCSHRIDDPRNVNPRPVIFPPYGY